MPRSKEIPEEIRKKVIEIYQSGKGYIAISMVLGSSEPVSEPLSANEENWEQWQTFPRVVHQLKLLQECDGDSSRRSQKNLEQHPKNCRPRWPQFRSVFTTLP